MAAALPIAVAAVVAGREAAAAAAVLVAGAAISFVSPALAAPWLALMLPVGYWHPELAGVQAPMLELAAAGAAAGYLAHLARAAQPPETGPAEWAFAAMLVGILISGLGPIDSAVWLHDAVFWGSLAVVFHAARTTLREPPARRRFLVAIAAAGLFEGVLALVQYAQASRERFSLLGGAIVYPQPEGTLQHPNALGPFLVVCLLLVLGAAVAWRGRSRATAAIVAAVLAAATVTPFSRGAWIALAAGGLTFIVGLRRFRLAAVLTGVMLTLGAILALFDRGPVGARLASLGSSDFTTLYGFRYELATRAAASIARHPLTGPGSFREVGTYVGRPTVATHPHDLFLGIAVSYGIPAAAAFAVLVGLVLAAAIRACSRPNVRVEAAAAAAAIVALLVDGLFEYPFWNEALAVLTVLVLAYAWAVDRSGAELRAYRSVRVELDPAPVSTIAVSVMMWSPEGQRRGASPPDRSVERQYGGERFMSTAEASAAGVSAAARERSIEAAPEGDRGASVRRAVRDRVSLGRNARVHGHANPLDADATRLPGRASPVPGRKTSQRTPQRQADRESQRAPGQQGHQRATAKRSRPASSQMQRTVLEEPT